MKWAGYYSQPTKSREVTMFQAIATTLRAINAIRGLGAQNKATMNSAQTTSTAGERIFR